MAFDEMIGCRNKKYFETTHISNNYNDDNTEMPNEQTRHAN